MDKRDYVCYKSKYKQSTYDYLYILDYLNKKYKTIAHEVPPVVYFNNNNPWKEIEEDEYYKLLKCFNFEIYQPSIPLELSFFNSLAKIAKHRITKKILADIGNMSNDSLGKLVKEFFTVKYYFDIYITKEKEKELKKYLNNKTSIIKAKFLPELLNQIAFIPKGAE